MSLMEETRPTTRHIPEAPPPSEIREFHTPRYTFFHGVDLPQALRDKVASLEGKSMTLKEATDTLEQSQESIGEIWVIVGAHNILVAYPLPGNKLGSDTTNTGVVISHRRPQ